MTSKIMEVVESEEKFDWLVNKLGVVVAVGGAILSVLLGISALLK